MRMVFLPNTLLIQFDYKMRLVVVVAHANSVLELLAHRRLVILPHKYIISGMMNVELAYLGATVAVARDGVARLLGVGLLALQWHSQQPDVQHEGK